MVRPDRPLGAGDLVAQVHPATERPADLELAHRAALEPDQRDRVVLGLDRMDERVRPAHHLDGPVLLAHVRADDLDAVAAEIDDRAAARLRRVPEPRAVWAGVSLARARPQHVADLPCLHRGDRLQRLRRVDEILEIAAEDARHARPCRASAWPPPRSARAASCRERPSRAERTARRPPRGAGSGARSRRCPSPDGRSPPPGPSSTPGRRCPRRTTAPAPPSGSRRRARGHDFAARAAFSCRRGR